MVSTRPINNLPLTFETDALLQQRIEEFRRRAGAATVSQVVRFAIEMYDFHGYTPGDNERRQLSVRLPEDVRQTLFRISRDKKASVGELLRAALASLPKEPPQGILNPHQPSKEGKTMPTVKKAPAAKTATKAPAAKAAVKKTAVQAPAPVAAAPAPAPVIAPVAPATAPKKAPARKAALKKAPAVKTAAAKAPLKKATATKAPAKKPAVKKTAAKKAPAKKAPAPKAMAKKAPARKPAAKK